MENRIKHFNDRDYHLLILKNDEGGYMLVNCKNIYKTKTITKEEVENILYMHNC